MEWDELPLLFPGLDGPRRWLPILVEHARLLEQAAPRVRVSSVSQEEFVQRHYAEALETLRIVGEGRDLSNAIMADVGSGGGFPGIAWAAVLPGAVIHLIEPLKKRAALLAEMAGQLGLANVFVHPVRGEEAGRGPLRDSAGLVTARAVATLPELLEYVAPLCKTGGWIALPKGSRLANELPEAKAAMRELRCTVLDTVAMRPEISQFGRVLLLRKRGTTPKYYPRKPGTPGKEPLGNQLN